MEWISVEDRLPDDESGYTVLVFANDILSSFVEKVSFTGEQWGTKRQCISSYSDPLDATTRATKGFRGCRVKSERTEFYNVFGISTHHNVVMNGKVVFYPDLNSRCELWLATSLEF